MRTLFLATLGLCLAAAGKSSAQTNLLLHNDTNILYHTGVSAVDSIQFANGVTAIHQPTGTLQLPNAGIDSMTFAATPPGDKIYIIYNVDSVTVINPFAAQGVTITVSQAAVTVTSTIATANLEYHLLGQSANGSLTLTSAQDVRLILSNLTLTNPTGPALKVSGNMTANVQLSANTVSTLSDGTASTGAAALLVSKALTVSGPGRLVVRGLKKHAVSTGTIFTLTSGTLGITKAVSDGIHTDSYVQNGGTLTLDSLTGDGVDATTTATINAGTLTITDTTSDVSGLKAANVVVNGGTTTITVSGKQAKALKGSSSVVINNGTLTLTASGTVDLVASGSGYDPSYCTAIKTDGSVVINGGAITLNLPATNAGGRGISADSTLAVNGGTITATIAGGGAVYTNTAGTVDSYTPCALKSDRHIFLYGGTITTNSTGLGGKGISADSTLVLGNAGAADSLLKLNVTTSGNRFLVSGTGQNADYANPKCIKAEGNLTVNSGIINVMATQSQEGGEGLESKATLFVKGGQITANTYDDCLNAANIQISGGTHHLTARNNDGVDANGPMTISGGLTISNGARAPEEGFDCDNNTFTVSGGVLVGTGGATSNPTATVSTQNTLKLTTTSPGTSVCIKNAANQVILIYQTTAFTGGGTGGGPGGGNSMVILFSDPALVNGTYTIQYGGTITGGTSFGGYYTGATYTGGTTKTVTVSSRLTSVTL